MIFNENNIMSLSLCQQRLNGFRIVARKLEQSLKHLLQFTGKLSVRWSTKSFLFISFYNWKIVNWLHTVVERFFAVIILINIWSHIGLKNIEHFIDYMKLSLIKADEKQAPRFWVGFSLKMFQIKSTLFCE